VDVLSVALSRDVPVLVRPVVSPVASRIARDSMHRTLDAMRQFGASLVLNPCYHDSPVDGSFTSPALERFSHRRSGRPSGRPSDGLKPVAYVQVETAVGEL